MRRYSGMPFSIGRKSEAQPGGIGRASGIANDEWAMSLERDVAILQGRLSQTRAFSRLGVDGGFSIWQRHPRVFHR